MESVRVDRWLWAVRIYKTRTRANQACTGGHVRINDTPAKPSHKVRPGDRVSARAGDRQRELEVVEAIEKRVGATRAAECFVDHGPPPPERRRAPAAGVRARGAGRPTKRERRQLDQLTGRRRR